jgi:hypothetical protein
MKWKALASKITNRIRSGSASSPPPETSPSPSSSAATDDDLRTKIPLEGSMEDTQMATENVQVPFFHLSLLSHIDIFLTPRII